MNISLRPSENFYPENEPAYLIPTIEKQSKPVVLITVDAEQQWQLAISAPIAGRIRQRGKIPILLATMPDGHTIQTSLVKLLVPALNSCVAMDFGSLLDSVQENCAVRFLPKASDCTQASLLAAMCFWQSTDCAVVGAIDDSEAAILGSTLACHLGVPFIPLSNRDDLNAVTKGLEILTVKHVVLVTSRGDFNTIPLAFSRFNTEVLGISSIQKRLVGAIGVNNIRNVILFRVQQETTDHDEVSWLAPYLSLMRSSVVVPCVSSDPLTAEEEVSRLIESFSLKPRTATILADYELIEMISESYGTELNKFQVLVEPCSRPAQGCAADLGVGRIPCRDVWAASTLIARGIANDYVLRQTAPKVLMIANTSKEYGSLPLCETISRATVQEFKNFKIHTDEFYGVPCHDQAVRRLAFDSRLIIYEGHITDFTLFNDPSVCPDYEYEYEEEWETGRSDDFVEVTNDVSDPDDYPGTESFHETGTGNKRDDVELSENDDNPDWQTADIHDQESVNSSNSPVDPCQFGEFPFLILQSCHSLDESAMRILKSGMVGILGSSTSVHSSSGSALVKAFCDGLLYRDQPIGVALRDARNYLLGVSALKSMRGHKEQAKVLRVAYAFHIWGDPECRMFKGLSPKYKPVSAEVVGPDQIRIVVPKYHLATSKTSKYLLRMFPGSQVAGIVKRLKDKDIRRIMPIYFFKIAMSNEVVIERYKGIKALNDTTVRGVFLVDSFKRFLYVLYFPEKETADRTFILQFIE